MWCLPSPKAKCGLSANNLGWCVAAQKCLTFVRKLEEDRERRGLCLVACWCLFSPQQGLCGRPCSAGPLRKAIVGQEVEALAETAKTNLVSHASVTNYHGTCDNLRWTPERRSGSSMGASCVTAGVSAELELQWRQITAKSWYTHVSIALLITCCLVDHVCLLESGFAGSEQVLGSAPCQLRCS